VLLLNFLDPLCITLVANLYFSQIKNLGCHTDNPEIPCEKPLQMGIHKKPSDYKLPESKINMIYHHETASTTWHLMDKGGLPKATLPTLPTCNKKKHFILLSGERNVLPPFQNVGRFYFSTFI